MYAVAARILTTAGACPPCFAMHSKQLLSAVGCCGLSCPEIFEMKFPYSCSGGLIVRSSEGDVLDEAPDVIEIYRPELP